MAKTKTLTTNVKKKPYSIEDLKKAFDLVKKGTSINAASKAFNVPYATLHSRVNEVYPLETKPGPCPILSSKEEVELVQWVLHLSKCGFQVTREHLFNSVQVIVKQTKKRTPFTNGRPSKHWYHAFLKRHPEITEKMYQNISKSRTSVTEKDLKEWFSEINSYLVSKNLDNITPERIFNIDESEFMLSIKPSKVLVGKGEKAAYTVCASDKECLTALIGGNAIGQLIPTMIVYNNGRTSPHTTKNFPDDFVIGKSETGCMTSETFYSYIVNHFYKWCLQNNIQFPVIIYVDGLSDHLTKTLSDFCSRHQIELIALYPNTTHIMQPIDVALFHPLKVAFRDAVRTWRKKNNGRYLTRAFFPAVLKTALYSLNLKKIFKNGFKHCGLFPFSQSSVNCKNLMKSSESSKPSIKQVNNKQPTNSVESNANELIESSEISEPSIPQKNNQILIDSDFYQKALNFVESHMNPNILEEFKNNSSKDWSTEAEYKELYNFWLSCKNSARYLSC